MNKELIVKAAAIVFASCFYTILFLFILLLILGVE